MGSCCTTTPERSQDELNTNPTKRADATLKATAGPMDDNKAAVTLQAHFKGLMTRRAIKEQYGFEAITNMRHDDPNTYTQSDA